ncbi:nitroreductase family protein [Bacillus kwashiorkori]|uniref:nitroreductase family protein n=1 Tax=Bacillus kwashiorkori TaxID=1522318 RepID=UPI000783A2AA|nr:nitroreductase family protein [Bacillus kwashiorkori]
MKISQNNIIRQPDYHIDDVFTQRWSPRSFLDKKIPDEDLYSVFEAARWAPSAFNEQPWRFIIARTDEERELFYRFISEFNLTWCKKAPVLALIISHTKRNEEENRSHSFDAGAAWGFLALQATLKGLVTHPMTGFDFTKARELLSIPNDYAIQALVAIGYQGDKAALPENLQNREMPNQRRPLSESIFSGKFGNTILK